MTDIAKANVTYADIAGKRYIDPAANGRFTNYQTITVGNNTLTYPTGGIPLDSTKMGMPQTVVEEVTVVDQGTNAKGFKFEWVSATNLLRVMVEDTVGTNTPLKEHTNATFVPNPATLIIKVRGY